MNRKALLESSNYREFLRAYAKGTGLSYAEIARRAGFSSRSYPRDVAMGRRRLTSRALPSLLEGLRLDLALTRYFRALFYLAHPEEHPDLASKDEIREFVDKCRNRAARGPIRRDFVAPKEASLGTALLGQEDGVIAVLASLGDPEKGATLDDIRSRTGYRGAGLGALLGALSQAGFISYNANIGKYFPASGHLNFSWLPANGAARAVFLACARRGIAAAESEFARPDLLFSGSAVSVRRNDLPALKEELRKVLLNFVDRTVERTSDPDTVVYLVSSLFESRLS